MALKKQHKDRYHFGSEERHEPVRWRTLFFVAALIIAVFVVAARAK
jgi:hypothetical protein